MRNNKHSRNIYITIIMFSIICTTFFLILMIFRIINERKFIIDKEKNNLVNMNDVMASVTSDYFGKIRLSLKIADLWLKSHPDADPRIDNDFVELIGTFREAMKGKVDIRLVSERGELFYIPSESMHPLADVKDRQYFTAQQNTATKGFYIAAPVQSRVTGKWGIPISYPLGSKNKDISIIFAAVEIPNLEKIFEPFRTKPKGSVILIRDDGVILATSLFDEKLIGKSIKGSKLWSNFIKNTQGGVGTYETDDTDGILRMVAYQKIEGLPLYIAATSDMRDVLAPWKDDLKLRIPIIIILFSVISGLVVLMMSLVNKLDKAMEEITYLSNTDPLTEIYNRRFLNKQLIQEIERTKRYACPFVLILLDIDYFKTINDTYGHEIGDVTLKALSKILLDNVRRTDIVSRWGGEEFIILCVNTEIDEGILAAEKLRDIIETTDFETVEHVTCSFGVSSYHKGDGLEDLLERADEALYISKDKGRNRVTVEKRD